MSQAKTKSTPPKREAEAPATTTPPAVLWGPPQANEPPGLKEARKRWAKLDKPDGRKAFRAVADLENPLTDISRVKDILYLICTTDGIEERESSALYLLASNIDDALAKMWALRKQAWDATWGFEFGEGKAVP